MAITFEFGEKSKNNSYQYTVIPQTTLYAIGQMKGGKIIR
jgi:hypothetical protein